MIRRSPAEVYLRYLILHPKRFTDQDIREACEFAQLDAIATKYLQRLRSLATPPPGFKPFDLAHWPSQQFLLREGLQSIFHPDEHGKKAFEMLKLPRVKEFVEAMLLVEAPLESIARHITQTKDYYCNVGDLKRYRSFFWNLKNCDSTEVRALLELRVTTTVMGEFVEDNHIPVLKKAFWGDPRKIAAEMPSSPYAALVAQMKMGLMPAHLDVPKTLHHAINMIAVRILESASGNGARDAEKVSMYANALKAVREITDNMEPPEEQLEKQLKALALRNDNTKLPTVAALTDGNYTTQLLPDELLQGEVVAGEEDDA